MIQDILNYYKKIQKVSSPDPKAKPIDRKKLYDFYVMRTLSIIPTYLFEKLKISPNATTVMSLCFSLLAAYLFFLGDISLFFLASLIFNFGFILDHVDGNLARIYKTSSQFGKFLDGSCNILGDTLVLFAIGFGYFKITTQIFWVELSFVILIITFYHNYISMRLSKDCLTFGVSLNDFDNRIYSHTIFKIWKKISCHYLGNHTVISFFSLMIFCYYQKPDGYLLTHFYLLSLPMFLDILFHFYVASIVFKIKRIT